MSIEETNADKMKDLYSLPTQVGSSESVSSFIEGQTTQSAQKKKTGIIDGLEELDPMQAVLFFIFAGGNGILDNDTKSIDDISKQIQDITDVYEDVTKMKKIFNQANGNTDPALDTEFLKTESELKEKLKNPNLSQVQDQFVNSIKDIGNALADGQTLSNIWRKAGGGMLDPNSIKIVDSRPDPTHRNVEITVPAELYKDFKKSIKGTMLPYMTGMTITYDDANHSITLKGDKSQDGIGIIDKSLDQVENIPRQLLQTYNANIQSQESQPEDLKKILSALDSMQSATSSISNNTRAQLNYKTSEYNEHLNFIKSMTAQVSKGNDAIIQQSK